ncbi:glycosyltransferase [Candidatus Micrarchaeota archaeon]|nr:glycosyltransferase [Candidatus Micrarchaeota archaeon]
MSIVIPTLDEEATIGKTARAARSAFPDAEVIVVDSFSTDATVRKAREAGARVVKAKRRGKGAAMAAGVKKASGSTIIFFDADLKNVFPRMFKILANPVAKGNCDVAIGTYRSPFAQSFTELVYRPLIKSCFPEVEKVFPDTPLSGLRALSKQTALQLKFVPDFGVEAGMNIDLALGGARVESVSLGRINPVFKGKLGAKVLKKRARQIAHAIAMKAKERGRKVDGRALKKALARIDAAIEKSGG